jgi:serine/threonine-protein kinase
VLSLDTGKITRVLDGGTNPLFSPSGHLLYVRNGSLVAVPFDPVRLELKGQSRSVADRIEFDDTNGVSNVSVSQNGLLAYVRSVRPHSTRVVWVDRNGRTEPLMDADHPFVNVRLAPDRQRLALTIGGPNDQVWMYHLGRHTMTPLTFDWDNWADSWTPDGRRIVIRSDREGAWNFYRQNVDGGGPVERLTESASAQGSGTWSPDGRVLAFHQRASLSDPENIWVLTGADERPAVRRLTEATFSEQEPAFSPDGRWLAYVSTETGREQVFVRPFPRLDAKWQVSSDGGSRPAWAPSGRELYYQNGRALMTVPIQAKVGFVPGTPQPLFEGDFVNNLWQDYDVASDGRFIMLQTVGADARPPELALVHNWFEELKR